MSQSYMYDMYPYQPSDDTEQIVMRATLDEAKAKGWGLDYEDYYAAKVVEVAQRADWESSHRPLSAQAAHAGKLAMESGE